MNRFYELVLIDRIKKLEEKNKRLKIEIKEHKKQNPVFVDNGNHEECMKLWNRIEELEEENENLKFQHEKMAEKIRELRKFKNEAVKRVVSAEKN
ncbi:hypothetical protein FQB35_15685 (plasmid) [Crassaminicella thermophila]|uniref:Uncharacterized protein n=1 Tax=Crassaminicella thermophila TaxID=2599308 RepID=A0A5C0SGS3_CRATE|nr:hypothetical protein [Crassaminicella thermophila]QEK13765.1 hypothetical protein FQB35_15685 [Crassaminicella thermophila]